MKFDDKRMKLFDRSKQNGCNLFVEGTGRIEDAESIDLTECVKPDLVIYGNPAYTVVNFPKRIKISKEYGNTVYDVVADFSAEGKDTILKQIQKLILSDQN